MSNPPEEPLTCSVCGCRSQWRAAFSQVKDGTLQRLCCPACRVRLARKHARALFWVLMIGIALVPAMLQTGNTNGMDLVVATGLLVMIWSHLLLIPHELGHVLAARLVGAPAFAIQIGQEPWLIDGHLAGLRWRIGKYLGNGLTFHAHCKGPRAGLHYALIALGGPLMNLAIGAVGFGVLLATGGLSGSSTRLVWFSMALASLVAFVVNLWPRHIRFGDRNHPSDGALLLRRRRSPLPDVRTQRAAVCYYRALFAFESRDFSVAARRAARASELWNDPIGRAALIVTRAAALAESDRAEDAVALLAPLAEPPQENLGLRASVTVNLAWSYFLLDQPELIERGLALVEIACELAPWENSFHITRGCLLVTSANPENRRLHAASELLARICAEKLRGQNAAYAALLRGLIAAAEGRIDVARRQYATAKSLHATAAPLRVLERRLPSR